MDRRAFLGAGLAGVAGSALSGPVMNLLTTQLKPERKMNVLFIAVDDLRPSLGCYGSPVVQSPNIDALAGRGTVFSRAYCQQAVCSPSRTSLLTGRRPDTTRIYNLEDHFRDTIPDVVTLPQQFKLSGYHSQGLSKLYHGGLDDEASWSVPHWRPKRPGYLKPETKELIEKLYEDARARGVDMKNQKNRPRGPAWEDPDCDDNALADGATADEAIRILNQLGDKPFFLGFGLLKPHLPFVAPKKYWDLYDHDRIELADNPFAPKNVPQFALTSWGELRTYNGIPSKGPVSDEQARWLIHGYYAATSYIDAQVGRVVGELDRLGLRENTAIVLWGDHGWQLGEHGLWCKHTNFETSVHSPLIISVPGQQAAVCDRLVEFVDIYPTLCDACGLETPDGCEGTSFMPLVDDPNRAWKSAAFSQYPRSVPGKGRTMGYSMRTGRYRFTEWAIPEKDFVEYELYDHEADPDENVNIARLPENEALVKQLSEQLHAGWKAAVPAHA